MIRILTVVGARPQFIKASSISKVLADKYSDQTEEFILHTGQHYDHNMSEIFFEELGIPRPQFKLNIQGQNSDEQFAKMYSEISKITEDHEFDAVLVYGDTNSTLAGALAGAKHNIPVVHIEAGLRSFNRRMPEEVNRVMTDHVSSLLFSPTKTGIENLKAEGISNERVDTKLFKTGDIMYDSSLNFSKLVEQNSQLYKDRFQPQEDFILCTVHRDFNTDSAENLSRIFVALDKISKKHNRQIIMPIHPRTSKMIDQPGYESIKEIIEKNKRIHVVPPVSYPEMLFLEKHSSLIMTDSGGVQKEAYFFGKKCMVLRPETEWVEIIEQGCGVLAYESAFEIAEKYDWFIARENLQFPPIFGNGKSAEYICKKIVEHLS